MIAIEDITCRIAGRELLRGASAHLPARRRIGLVGRNGAGKTTLLKLLKGTILPDAGTIALPADWRIGAVAQEAPGGDVTLIDTVLAADGERIALLEAAEHERDPARLGDIHGRLQSLAAWSAPARAAAILSGLGFSADAQQRPAREFSGGWRMRVALAAVLFAAPDLLLLDEPTNYLDLEGVLWLEDYLRRYRGTVLLVSHDRDLLDSVAEFILHLDAGKLTLYTGNYETFAETRAARLALDAAAAKKREAARRHMQAFVDRFRYKQSKARQAQSRLKMLARLKPVEATIDDTIAPIRFPPASAASPPLVSLENVCVGYDPGNPVLSGVSLRIDPGERIALLGKNGNGKSTFAKLICGRLAAFSGSVHTAPKFNPGYFAQHQLEELDGETAPLGVLGRLRPKLSDSDLRTRLGGFGLSGERALTEIRNLSGGERARLMLALATLDAPNLLVLDEPTNHLDIDAREELLAALADYEGAIVLVSHDRRLVEATADRLLLLVDGAVRSFDGDIEDYRREVLSAGTDARAKPRVQGRRDLRREAAARRLELKPLREKALAAEAVISDLTRTIAQIDSTLSKKDVFSRDPVQATALSRRRADAARALEEAETAWLHATQAYEDALAEAERR